MMQKNHRNKAIKSVICATKRTFYAMELQATAIKDMLHAATNYGEAYDKLRAMAGFTEEEISDSAKMVEWQKAARLYDLLADLTGNEQIGLAMGLDVTVAATGMVGFLMQASRTFEDAIRAYCNYGYMVCPMLTYHYSVDGDHAIIDIHQSALWKNTYPRNARIGVDFSLAATVNFTKLLTGRQIYPLSVEVEFSRTALSAYRQVLGCQVLFNAPVHRMIFSVAELQAPVITSDVSLREMFSRILAQKKSLELQNTCREKVKNLLLMQYKGQIPTIEDAAEGTGMTVRTLQRKLTEEQTSFREVANEVRKELALHLMKNSATSITEVASVLGYADLPAFRRAFKTWTNATPKEMRQQFRNEYAVA